MTGDELRQAAATLRKEAKVRKTVKSAQALEALAGLEKLKRFLLR
jgi:hypothetical protein